MKVNINPIQEFISQLRISFLGDDLMHKYDDEKAPIRSELFSLEQLESYARTLAASHQLTIDKPSEQLLKRLAENEEILLEVHNLLTASVKENKRITPAGEWLLDNFYLIEEQLYTGKKHLPKGYSKGLPQLAKGPSAGLPRVYDLAVELIAHSDGRVDLKSLNSFTAAYQEVSELPQRLLQKSKLYTRSHGRCEPVFSAHRIPVTKRARQANRRDSFFKNNGFYSS